MGIHHVSILPRKKRGRNNQNRLKTLCEEWIHTNKLLAQGKDHIRIKKLNHTSATTKFSFPWRWKFPSLVLGLGLLTVIFPLCSFVDIWFQCFTAVLILFCLSYNKDIVVTKYYANWFCLVLKIHCTALFQLTWDYYWNNGFIILPPAFYCLGVLVVFNLLWLCSNWLTTIIPLSSF